MDHEIVTLAERPDLMDVFWDMETSWPEFMKHDPIGNSYCVEPNVWVRHAAGR